MAEDIEHKKRIEKVLVDTAEYMRQASEELKKLRLELQIITGAVVD